ncbi:AAA family ATPase [Desulfoluna spongiiphila]|uniref:ATPase family associated with various cellular activities (AAA) n=1 Tax=Desulfoluna spongiiphila TaxID=419481 RepID=A0A1G5J226_9BACT|nr:AAA family ATPase [Desulfoluna spongiiphila]SCY82317.1 ATPase family associated with various cellular activities (AAA) [Desulfoluna spongiiphila]
MTIEETAPISEGTSPCAGGSFYLKNADHLADELTRLDLLIRHGVHAMRRRLETHKHPGDTQGAMGIYISDTHVDRLLDDQAIQVDSTPEMSDAIKKLEKMGQQITRKVSESRARHIPLALPLLAGLYDLSPIEMQVVVICLAPELDRKYDTLYAYLQDDITRKRPSMDLILSLLCRTPAQRWSLRAIVSRESHLLQQGILQTVEDSHSPSGSSNLATFLRVDRRIVGFLLNHNAPDPRIKEMASIDTQGEPLDRVLVPAPIKSRALNLMRRQAGTPSVLYLHGPRGSEKRGLARAVCRELGCPMLRVDLSRAAPTTPEADHLMWLAFREGLLTGALLLLDNVQCLPATDEALPFLKKMAQRITEFASPVFMTGDAPWTREATFGEIPFASLALPMPAVPMRETAWQRALEGKIPENTGQWPTLLARRFALPPGQIRDAARFAEMQSQMNGPDTPLTLPDLFAGCRQQSGDRLAELSVHVKPGCSWDDLVLPDEKTVLLKEICAQVRHKDRVFSDWGFDAKIHTGKGLSVLFSGPPGTGKTMAAQVIARDLQLSLYKIDLSGVVSKYIGETEKNLGTIFREAEKSHAILFFDEADAIFGKRTELKDAHDRYANIETSYLLQKMEEYEGVVILASNFRSNMDEAFTRRLRFIVEFPFPDAGLREKIWRNHVPDTAPLAETLDFTRLARRFEVAGGTIKNIVLNSAFLAADTGESISTDHIMGGVKREFEKMGKLWTDEADR